MAREEITITLDGLPSEDGNVRLHEFALVLEKLRSALIHANQHISGSRRAVLHVSRLSHNSPALVGIQNRQETPGLLKAFSDALMAMGNGKAAALIGYRAIEDVFEATKRVTLNRLGGIRIDAGPSETLASIDHYAVLDADYATRLQRELAPTETCHGTIEGILEALNLHDGANRFTIFPASVDKGITCFIPERLHDAALSAVRGKVAVSGKLKFRPRDMLPCAVEVEELESFPPDSELPTFAELRGIAPNMTGDLSTEEYLAEIRDAWD